MNKKSPLATKRAIHGALDFAELAHLNLAPDDILDFSVNANPYGPSPSVRTAIADTVLDRYPDRECLQLRRAILQYELAHTHLPLSSIVCGNGASELIWACAHAFLQPEAKASIIGPTFGEYRTASQGAGATVCERQAYPEHDFRPSLDTLLAWLQSERPALVWLCNPNNPTGHWLEKSDIFLIAEICQRMDALLVVDESYWRFVWPGETFSAIELLQTDVGASVLVVRSLTKDFALAGLRLGYAVGRPETIECVRAQLPAWNVNGLAQAAGRAALADRDHLHGTLARLVYERHAFFAALKQTRLRVVPSRTHYCLIEVGDARRVRGQLLMHRMLVRDCTSFGLPQFIRVATRPAAEWQRLLNLLPEVVSTP